MSGLDHSADKTVFKQSIAAGVNHGRDGRDGRERSPYDRRDGREGIVGESSGFQTRNLIFSTELDCLQFYINKMDLIYAGLVFAQLLTFAAYAVVTHVPGDLIGVRDYRTWML